MPGNAVAPSMAKPPPRKPRRETTDGSSLAWLTQGQQWAWKWEESEGSCWLMVILQLSHQICNEVSKCRKLGACIAPVL